MTAFTFMESAPPATPPKLSREEREALILKTMPLVYSIAKRLTGSLSHEISMEDLVSAGTVGLIKAVDHYDPALETSLVTYASHRIRGAMLDSIRAADWVPRRQRGHIKRIQNAIGSAQQKHQRLDVTEQEIAAELQTSVEAYRDELASISVVRVVSIDETEREGTNAAEMTAEDEAQQPSAILERAELQTLLAGAIRHLSEEERMVLHLYYEENLSPQEIARVMSLPARRVYQLKAQAILRLRTALNRRLLRRKS